MPSPFRDHARPTALEFRDFVPVMLDPGGIVTAPRFKPFESAVRAANEWLQKSGVTVVNVETLLLPNLTLLSDNAPSGVAYLRGSEHAYWYQVVRVWYDAG
jgi:hypothetical protein